MRPNRFMTRKRAREIASKPSAKKIRVDAILATADRVGKISAEEARFLLANLPKEKTARGHKYAAQKVTVDGHEFPSKAEADRYCQLKLLVRASTIRDLELQPKFPLLAPNGTEIGEYWADFAYTERLRGIDLEVVEDVKGMVLPLYKLKLKLFRELYPTKTFREIRK